MATTFLPSPSAVIVLPGHRARTLVVRGALVIAYRAGTAVTLTGEGLLLHARDALDRRFSKVRRSWLANVGRHMPIGAAVLILGVDAYLWLGAAVLI